ARNAGAFLQLRVRFQKPANVFWLTAPCGRVDNINADWETGAMSPITIAVSAIHPQAQLPRCAHSADEDAGMDLCAIEELRLAPGAWGAIGTGLILQIPPGYEGQVRPRSGLALRHGVTLLNAPGTIDPGYRGEVRVILINHGKE